MRDGKEGIAKAINNYELSEQIRRKNEQWQLSAGAKELIEYGFIQCMLQVGQDIMTKEESFISGLQEIVLGNDKNESYYQNGISVVDMNGDYYAINGLVEDFADWYSENIEQLTEQEKEYIIIEKLDENYGWFPGKELGMSDVQIDEYKKNYKQSSNNEKTSVGEWVDDFRDQGFSVYATFRQYIVRTHMKKEQLKVPVCFCTSNY